MSKNIKNISKELLGKSLSSFHRKTGLPQIEKNDEMQDGILDGILSQTDDGYLEKTEQSSVIHLENSGDGVVVLGDIEGQTLVNYCENGNLEITTNNEIDTEGYGHITLNDTTEGGVLDLSLEGDTLVNVCNQKDPIAITKSYTVENTNHIPLQGEFDGKCRPVIEGNTMVNYCIDGNRELVLNNEINVEGVNITLNDTVDNGLVDVACEGNTLVNLLQNEGSFNDVKDYLIHQATNVTCSNNELSFQISQSTGVDGSVKISKKKDTYYTIVYTTKTSNTNTSSYIRVLTGSNRTTVVTSSGKNNTEYSTYKFLLTPTMLSNYSEFYLYYRGETSSSGNLYFKNVMVLEGDWTNKEVPKYFEGMKSVGQDDENGHKIEILSQNKNLFDGEFENGNIGDNGVLVNNPSYVRSKNFIKVKPNTNYYISGSSSVPFFYDSQYNFISRENDFNYVCTSPINAKYMKFRIGISHKDNDIQVEENSVSTEYTPHQSDRKEIPLSEPLRSLPNGVKDKIVKKGGKWYIERNCIEVRVTSDLNMRIHNTNDILTNFCVHLPNGCNPKRNNTICNTLVRDDTTMANGANIKGYYIDPDQPSDHTDIYIRFLSSECNTLSSFENYISENNISFVTQLVTPTYEPLETEPILNTYTDATYISNNSIIPCNMQVKNNEFNCILNPNRLYTVVLLGANTGEVIRVDLGGAETSTINNFATITTPSTLTSNNLKLYGKGVKLSSVMVLEGDETSSIPNRYVEGLESSFENTISKNLCDNIFEIGSISYSDGVFGEGKNSCSVNYITVKPNTTYSVSIQYNTPHYFRIFEYDINKKFIRGTKTPYPNSTFTTESNTYYIKLHILTNGNLDIGVQVEEGLVVTDYAPYGKYRVDYRVIGKNKFNRVKYTEQHNKWIDENGSVFTTSGIGIFKEKIDLRMNTTYTVSGLGGAVRIFYYLDDVFVGRSELFDDVFTFTTTNFNQIILGYCYASTSDGRLTWSNIQLEENSTNTSHENYKEYTKTFYLNSPLLQGDTIEDINGKATHVKRYKQVVFDGSEDWFYETWGTAENTIIRYRTGMSFLRKYVYMNNPFVKSTRNWVYEEQDLPKKEYVKWTNNYHLYYYKPNISNVDDFKQWLSENPMIAIYELASPIYETISEESILCDSYVNGHLDFDTNVPITKVKFRNARIENKSGYVGSIQYLMPNTKYIVQFTSDNSGILTSGYLNNTLGSDINITKGINRLEVTTGSSIVENALVLNGIGFNASNISVVATDKEFDYFEGLKSSFEDNLITDVNDVNYGKYKVEYRVIGKNKFNINGNVNDYYNNMIVSNLMNTTENDVLIANLFSFSSHGKGQIIKVNPNTNYTLSFNIEEHKGAITIHSSSKTNIIERYFDLENNSIVFNSGDNDFLCISFLTYGVNDDNLRAKFSNIQLEEGSTATEYEPYKESTKTIYLNSPLLKGDTIEVVDGKLCHVHRYEKVVLDGSEVWKYHTSGTPFVSINTERHGVHLSEVISNTLPNNYIVADNTKKGIHIANSTDYKHIRVRLTDNDTVESVKAWLSKNPTTVIYKLAEPIYQNIEPLQTELVTNTWNDITDVSTNSAIYPKVNIENKKPYDCIIKPNTKYSVIFDKLNTVAAKCILGGGESVISSSNKIILTTPSTLVDNKLNFIGKGAKVKNVRLIEGEVNFDVPYFEGLQSSFEEHKEGDQYKFEILSNNNLINKTLSLGYGNIGSSTTIGVSKYSEVYRKYDNPTTRILGNPIPIIEGKCMIFECDGYMIAHAYFDKNLIFIADEGWNDSSKKIIPPKGARYICSYFRRIDGLTTSQSDIDFIENNGKLFVCDDVSDIKNLNNIKQNKIKLLINEPLRAIGSVKDRLIIKDGRLVVERLCRKVTSNEISYSRVHQPANYPNRVAIQASVKDCLKDHSLEELLLCNVLPYKRLGFDVNYDCISTHAINDGVYFNLDKQFWNFDGTNGKAILNSFLQKNSVELVVRKLQPSYEEVLNEYGEPIILEGYENGTIYIDSTIIPTTTVRYTPKMESFNTLKEVKSDNGLLTDDINDNIIPYMMDVDLMIMEKEMDLISSFNKNIRTMEVLDMTSMQKRTQQMLERLIKGKTLTEQECQTRVTTYLNANKITDEQAEELMLLISEVYA